MGSSLLPPAGRFSLGRVITAAEFQRLRALDAEMIRLRGMADEYAPAKVRAAIKAKRDQLHAQPTPENFAQFEKASLDDPNNVHLELRFRELHTAARKLVWAFYHREVKPTLTEMLERGIVLCHEESDAQQMREAVWTEEFAKWAAWGKYYSVHLPFPAGICDALAAQSLNLHRTIEEVQIVEINGSSPPEIGMMIGRLGVSLNDSLPANASDVAGGSSLAEMECNLAALGNTAEAGNDGPSLIGGA